VDKKFYCHYDIRTLSIYQISSNETCSDNEYIRTFEIPFSQAQSLLLGQTSTLDWSIDTSKKPFKLITASKIDNSRINIYCLNELIELNDANVELILYNNKLTTKILNKKNIYLNEVQLYITKKNDPSVLFQIIYLDVTKNNSINIEKIDKDFSIFTNDKIIKFSLIRMDSKHH